jgi:hypothetical protein
MSTCSQIDRHSLPHASDSRQFHLVPLYMRFQTADIPRHVTVKDTRESTARGGCVASTVADKLKTIDESEASHAMLTLHYTLKMLARNRRGAPKWRHSIGSTLDGVNVVLRATGSCVPDHFERAVGDGEDECGATTVSKHQDSIPRATVRSIPMTTMKDKVNTVGNIYYGRHGKNLAEVAVPNQSFNTSIPIKLGNEWENSCVHSIHGGGKQGFKYT